MRARALAIALAAAVLAVPAGASARFTPQQRAAAYLVGRQAADGSFGKGQPADGVAETMAALLGAGVGGAPVERALGFIREHGPARAAEGAGLAGRIVMGLVAASEDPASFGGTDYVATLESSYDPITGAYDPQLYAHALASLGVIAARGEVPARAVDYLRANECAGGGFGFARGCLDGPDADTTSLAVTVVASEDRGDAVVGRARAALRTMQNGDGGFGHAAGEPTDANATGLALSALAAIGDEPREEPWLLGRGRDPWRALLGLQASSGGFRYRAGEPVNDYATVQALPGLAGLAYPIAPQAGNTWDGTLRAPGNNQARTEAPTDGSSPLDPVRTSRAAQEKEEPQAGSRPSAAGVAARVSDSSSVQPVRSARSPWIIAALVTLIVALAIYGRFNLR